MDEVARAEAALTATPPTAEHKIVQVTAPPAVVLARTRALLRAPDVAEAAPPSWVRGFFARLWALIARIFGKTRGRREPRSCHRPSL